MTERRSSDVGAGPFEPWPGDVDVHVEWGEVAAAEAARRGDLVCVVDVMSFSTSVSLAVDRGATVYAMSGAAIEAMGGRDAIASRLGAHVVSKDRRRADGAFTLSPASFLRVRQGDAIVITSLNGALIVGAALEAPVVVVGCLANRSAAAALIARCLVAGEVRRASLVPCGEQWPSVSTSQGMRPSLEDWIGVGGIADALARLGHVLSVEAQAAAAAFAAASDDLGAWLRDCVSGRELIAKGFPEDVELAAAVDSLASVPLRRRCADGRISSFES